jgi:hypothetical protein
MSNDPNSPFQWNTAQVEALHAIHRLMETHFEAAILAVIGEHPNNSTQESIQTITVGSPSRCLALSHIALRHVESKFVNTGPAHA